MTAGVGDKGALLLPAESGTGMSPYEIMRRRAEVEREGLEATIKAAMTRYTAIERELPTQDELDALWRTSVMVAAFATFRADNLSQVPFRVLDGDDREPPKGHVLARLFSRRFADVVRRTELTLQYKGSNLLYKRRNLERDWIATRWLNPNLWRPDIQSLGLAGFHLYHGGYQYERAPDSYVDARDALYMHEMDFESDYEGVGWVERAFNSAASEEEMSLTVLAFMRNRAVPLLIITPAAPKEGGINPGASGPERRALDDFADNLKTNTQGSRNAGRTVIDPYRWEVNQIEVRFDQAAMPELYQQIQESTSLASGVPLSLVMSDKASYADAYGQEQRWLGGWLIPRAGWYAEWFTEAVQAEFGTGWRVEADTSQVAKRIAALNSERVIAEVGAGIRDLYTAQREIGLEPDERLQGVYLVGSVPMRAEVIADAASSGAASAYFSHHAAPQITGDREGALPPRPDSGLGDLGAHVPAPAPAPDQPKPEQGDETPENVAATDPLSGIAVTTSLEVIDKLAQGLIPESVALNSLVGLGFSAEAAQQMIEDTKVFEPEIAPADGDETTLKSEGKGVGFGFLAPFHHDEGVQRLRDQVEDVWQGEDVTWLPPAEWHLSLIYAQSMWHWSIITRFLQLTALEVQPAFSVEVAGYEIWSCASAPSLRDAPEVQSGAARGPGASRGDGTCLVAIVEPSDELLALHSVLHEAFDFHDVPVTAYSEPGNYKPHITLAYGGPRDVALPDPPEDVVLLVDGVALTLPDTTLYTWHLSLEPLGAGPDGAALKAVFDEMDIWTRQDGKSVAFTPQAIPPDTAAVVRQWLQVAPAGKRATAFDEGRAHYVTWHTGGHMPQKGFTDTATGYRVTLTDLVTRAFEHDGGVPVLDRKTFGDLGRAEIRAAFSQAYLDGMREGGAEIESVAGLSTDAQGEIKALANQEAKYWTKLANELYKKVLPQRAHIEYMFRAAHDLQQVCQETGDEQSCTAAARRLELADNAFAEFQKQQRRFLNRIASWVNKGLGGAFEAGKLAADDEQLMIWVYGDTVDHCATCRAAQGQIHRAKDWRKANVLPKQSNLECHGDRCDCRLVPAPPGSEERGDLSRIPLF